MTFRRITDRGERGIAPAPLRHSRLSVSVPLWLCVFFLSASLSLAGEKRYVVPLDNSPIYGPADAPVTIFEFLDYQ